MSIYIVVDSKSLSKCIPYFSICSLPAFPKICGVAGALSKPLVSIMTSKCLSIGLVRSVHWNFKLLELTKVDPLSYFTLFFLFLSVIIIIVTGLFNVWYSFFCIVYNYGHCYSHCQKWLGKCLPLLI